MYNNDIDYSYHQGNYGKCFSYDSCCGTKQLEQKKKQLENRPPNLKQRKLTNESNCFWKTK